LDVLACQLPPVARRRKALIRRERGLAVANIKLTGETPPRSGRYGLLRRHATAVSEGAQGLRSQGTSHET
jgi:hypothetical protein